MKKFKHSKVSHSRTTSGKKALSFAVETNITPLNYFFIPKSCFIYPNKKYSVDVDNHYQMLRQLFYFACFYFNVFNSVEIYIMIYYKWVVYTNIYVDTHYTKMKFSIKDFFSKCDQIRRKLFLCSFRLVDGIIYNC